MLSLNPMRTEVKSVPPSLRLELDPLQTIDGEAAHDIEPVAHRTIAAEQHGGARCRGILERSDGDLRELDVVNPEIFTVGDDRLLDRLDVVPQETVRPLQRERAGGGLEQPLIGGPQLLTKVRRQASNVVEEAIERLLAVRFGSGRSAPKRGPQGE